MIVQRIRIVTPRNMGREVAEREYPDFTPPVRVITTTAMRWRRRRRKSREQS